MATNLKERESDLDEVFARFSDHPLGATYSTATDGALSESQVRELGLGVLSERRPALTSLVNALRAQGIDVETAAQTLDAPEGLVWKLHRRLIAFETIPQAFVARLAESVRRNVDELSAYLRQPPMLATGASYRADTAPEALVESFETALANDDETTDAMVARWRES